METNQGWITLHRKMTEWEWYSDINTKVLFLHLLLTCNHKEKRWQGTAIRRGQKVTSYEILAAETGLSVRNIRTSIDKLKSTGEVTYQSTNRYSLLTINNYDTHQATDRQFDRQPTGDRQTTDRQPTTNNNDNNENNIKKISDIGKTKKTPELQSISACSSEVKIEDVPPARSLTFEQMIYSFEDFKSTYESKEESPELLGKFGNYFLNKGKSTEEIKNIFLKFYDYWTEPDRNGQPRYKDKKYKYFDCRRRLLTFFK